MELVRFSNLPEKKLTALDWDNPPVTLAEVMLGVVQVYWVPTGTILLFTPFTGLT
jgi:hypothetical protein